MNAFLWVLLCFFFLLTVILFSPLHIKISYDECGFGVIFRVLFFYIHFPRTKKKNKKTQTESVGAKRKGGSFSELMRMLRLVIHAVGKLLKTVRIRSLKVDATIASTDPFQTAMMFGGSAAGVGVLLPLIEEHFRLQKKTVCVNANFEETESKLLLQADCTIPVVYLLAIALVFVYNFWKEQKMNASVQRKDGNNGRTKSK